jgi:hypothetical protein
MGTNSDDPLQALGDQKIKCLLSRREVRSPYGIDLRCYRPDPCISDIYRFRALMYMATLSSSGHMRHEWLWDRDGFRKQLLSPACC